MGKYRVIQSSFTAGEISPRMLARTDLQSYEKAVAKMENATPLPHGGAKRRTGTTFVASVRNSAKPSRLIPFVYSRTQSFVLVFNDGYIRFVSNGQMIMSGGVPYEIAHPYSDSELTEMTYAQEGNVLILAHPNHVPQRLSRASDTSWSLSDMTFEFHAIADYWYDTAYLRFKLIRAGEGFVTGDQIIVTTDGNGNVTAVDKSGLSPSTTGDIVEITIDGDLDPVGGQNWVITCTFDTTDREEFSVSGTVTGTPIAKWSPGNYPKAVSFFEQRLFFAACPKSPQTLWGSKIGLYTVFTVGPLDDDAVQFTIASNRYDEIIQLESARNLLAMSYGGEFSVAGTSSGGVTPSAVSIRAHTFHGTSDVKPIRIGQEVMFVQRDNKKVRAISYDVTLDANVAPDVSILAEHITGNGIVDLTYQQDPDSVAWAVREDGVLLSLTHLREQDVTAWARHLTPGKFKNVCSVPEATTDRCYVVVERTINGITEGYVEYLSPDSYTDSAIHLSDATGKTSWTGLDHLEGETVQVRADGRQQPSVTVVGGSVDILTAAKEVEFGLPFSVTIELLHPEVTLSTGTSQGSATSIQEAVLRLQDSVGVTVNGYELPMMTTNEIFDQPLVPFTGDKTVSLTGWRTPHNLKIEHTLPMPFTLLGVILKVVIND